MSTVQDLPIEAIMDRNSPSNKDQADVEQTPRRRSRTDQQQQSPMFPLSSLPPGVEHGLLIPPRRAPPQPRSNLAALFESPAATDVAPVSTNTGNTDEYQVPINEADSASGPTTRRFGLTGRSMNLARSDPMLVQTSALAPPDRIPLSLSPSTASLASDGGGTSSQPRGMMLPRYATTTNRSQQQQQAGGDGTQEQHSGSLPVRRCISSRELGTLAPPSGSPYAEMLYQQQKLQDTLQQRLYDARRSSVSDRRADSPAPSPTASAVEDASSTTSADSSKRRAELKNETRNRRRAEHNRAVTNDLVEIVTDLLRAEAKLVKPSSYGLEVRPQRESVLRCVGEFCAALPPRYALGVDTPSEVLLHMRLMAAARTDHSRAVVHVTHLKDSQWAADQSCHLVTISCCDAQGLLEFITKLLATGGSRVLDADVMLSSDNIALDRFVVQMKGRLRLDKFAQSIETFLTKSQSASMEGATSGSSQGTGSSPSVSSKSAHSPPGIHQASSGPVYFNAPSKMSHQEASPGVLRHEIDGAVPLSEILTAWVSTSALTNLVPMRRQSGVLRSADNMHRGDNVPPSLMQPFLATPETSVTSKSATPEVVQESGSELAGETESEAQPRRRPRRPLVNRQAINLSDEEGEPSNNETPQDYMTAPTFEPSQSGSQSAVMEDRIIPLVPFEELMLIETLGMGRVSTIYRAAWQKNQAVASASTAALMNVTMVALKVATVHAETGDTTSIDELRREADIAAMLQHSHVCQLKGVAADTECFCLAYEFCEGGSLLNLLLDTGRYYEYLPIALDIANGMAYLHSRHVIHRDLKPSNVLLTRDHRAKIADFGMSVANSGQELTAETGTYRYMSPEVIRHESYSSNADVYSFGIVLWQLITREVPFSTMTPIQAAFAVAQGRRPDIPSTCPDQLRGIMEACWQQDATQRPSFTYIAMALADYARMAFSPANVGTQTLQIANEMLATVEGNATINVDFSIAPVQSDFSGGGGGNLDTNSWGGGSNHNIGLEIE